MVTGSIGIQLVKPEIWALFLTPLLLSLIQLPLNCSAGTCVSPHAPPPPGASHQRVSLPLERRVSAPALLQVNLRTVANLTVLGQTLNHDPPLHKILDT